MAFKGSPVLFYDVGVWGKLGNANVTYLNIGAYAGLAVPF